MRISVILSTYNQPVWLEKVLWGYAHQTRKGFEVVVADDGSTAATAVLLERVGGELGLDVVHVWHEDRGFRKCEILNRAILASSGEYLVFSDGDCIPRHDFLEVHADLAAEGRFLSGGYLKLPASLSDRIGYDDVASGRFAELGWLRQNGWSPGRRTVRLLSSQRAAGVLDLLTPTRATWNGHNASTWREAVLAVNGFDAEMKYGGEDRALGERLENFGFRGVQIRHRAPVLHLDHGRPYVEEEVLRRNRAIRDRIVRDREVRATVGIQEIRDANEPGVTRRLGVR
jgi:glycosyltransferase involved in cell wall biosynthesis